MGGLFRHLLEFCLSRLPVQGVIIGNHTQGMLQVRREIEALSPCLEFIHHDQLLNYTVHKKSRPFCLLTFDDGKKITSDEAAAELERCGIPAVFYIVTGAVSNQTPLWFDRRNAVIRHLQTVPEDLTPHHIKQLPFTSITTLLDRYFDTYPVTIDVNDPCVASMTWDDVKALDRKGFTIGAHTENHPVLINETWDDAIWEIGTSINKITELLGRPCQSFAFPNGSHTRALAKHALGCGVKTVMTTIPVWVGSRHPLWRLPRVDVYNHYDKKKIWLKLTAALPGIFLKNPDGTGRQYVIERWFSD